MQVGAILLGATLLLGSSFGAQAAHTQARLVLAAESARPGETVLSAVHLHMDADWHTYWRNSGESGLPTTIQWELPPGVTAGEVQWPAPKKVPEKELTTYVYEGDVFLLVPLKLASDLNPGPLTLKAKLDWLECEKECVKEGTGVEATLTVGQEAKPSKDAEALGQWEKKLPKPATAVSPRAWWENAGSGDVRPCLLEWNTTQLANEADFYPDNSDVVQPATEKVSGEGKVRLRVQVKKSQGSWPKEISGLLIQQSGAERLAYEAKLTIGEAAGGSKAGVTSGTTTGTATTLPLWRALLYAFLGGLILNVMPCVLPVIALKILGFVSEARNAPARVRTLGLIYTGGVLTSFLVLALVVVGLQAADQAAGWGIQFANPYFVVAMTVLVTLISLNLFGVFEVSLGSGTLTAANELASKHGSSGAFFNGLLATALATSCSAPILADAIGFAFLLKKPWVTVLILLTVGAGLATPYLVLSYQPAWVKFLPKPGVWMQRFKVAMGFPMLGASVWLCSLVAVHYGERAWWMAVFLVFLAVSAWVYGEFVQRGTRRRWLAGLVALALLVVGYEYAMENHLAWRKPNTGTTSNSARDTASAVAPRGMAWEKWSPEAVAEARKAGRPVVVDFTAKWCPTCNTIFKPAFESAAVQKKLKEVNAVPLVADATLFPRDISEELKRFNRAAVPFALIYPRKADAEPMTFNWLSADTIVDALDRAAQ